MLNPLLFVRSQLSPEETDLKEAIAGFLEEADAPDLTRNWTAEHLAHHSSLRPAVERCAKACFPAEQFDYDKASPGNNPLLVAFCAEHFPTGGTTGAAGGSATVPNQGGVPDSHARSADAATAAGSSDGNSGADGGSAAARGNPAGMPDSQTRSVPPPDADTPLVEVKADPGRGYAAFAKVRIGADTGKLLDYTGVRITKADAAVSVGDEMYMLAHYDGHVFDAKDPSITARYIQHGYDTRANVQFRSEPDGTIGVYPLRMIEKGEKLHADYGPTYPYEKLGFYRKLHDCQLIDYTDKDEVMHGFVAWGLANFEQADEIFLKIAREKDNDPEMIPDPDHKQIFIRGNGQVAAYDKSVAVQKLLQSILTATLGRTNWSAHRLVALLRRGKGAGHATGK